MATAYDPAKHYEIKVWDVEFRRDPVRTLMARIYQPQGNGPFPRWIFTAARGTTRTALLMRRWTKAWRRAVF